MVVMNVDPVPPTPIPIDRAGQYILPAAQRFLGWHPASGTEPGLLRFDLGNGRTLDLPLSREALSDTLEKLAFLKPSENS